MKKHLLLLAAAAMVAGNAYAAEPVVISNTLMTTMSPDGNWVVGANPFTYTIDVYNVATGELFEITDPTETDQEMAIGYVTGCVANDGTVLFAAGPSSLAMYWKDGEAHILPTPEGVESAFADVITPDGSVIAGTMGLDMSLEATDIMQKPVIWTRQPDGSYSDPYLLPYPEKDITGRTPQYVLIGGINEHGNIIAAELHDYAGQLDVPMIYTRAADGEWSYSFLGSDLVNPYEIELPEYPGEDAPQAEDYMTDEEKAAYQAALEHAATLVQPVIFDFMSPEELDAYNAAMEAFNNGTSDVYPSEYDYVTEEELEAYNAASDQYWAEAYPKPSNFLSEEAKAKYEEDLENWETAISAFFAAYSEIMDSSVQFGMNAFQLSPDGSHYAVQGYMMAAAEDEGDDEGEGDDEDEGDDEGEGDDPEIDPGFGFPMIELMNVIIDFNTADPDDYAIYYVEGEDLVSPYFVSDEGVILACRPVSFQTGKGETWIIRPYEDPELFVNYVEENDPELFAWLKENFYLKYWDWDWDLDEDVEKEGWFLGQTNCNADMTRFVSYELNWGQADADIAAYSAVYGLTAQGGVDTVVDEVAALSVAINAEGEILINGAADEVTVYDLQGRVVFAKKAPAAVVATGLGHGAYIVKATAGDITAVAKAIL